MATLKGTESNVVDLLNSLIELDYDAIEAYRAAISRLDETSDRSSLAQFMQDHERHVSTLTSLVERMGATAKQGGDLKQVLTKGKVVLAGLVGDRMVMMAMKTNEDDTNTAYERAAAHPDLPADVGPVLQQNLADERRHRAWIVARIEEMDRQEKYRKSA